MTILNNPLNANFEEKKNTLYQQYVAILSVLVEDKKWNIKIQKSLSVQKTKNAPPTGGHVFSPIWTISELVRKCNKTNQKLKTSPPTGGHWTEITFERTGTIFELNQYIIKTNILTKIHEDWA
ncbi:hypothetical protein DPMN_116125 [Dreissena polymorpha]|uniref:Uncharacterized protein n=1 Tax=Dreissena polymorpha TaxID=45954 RepID=A0A9D4QT47_DREPO|nr:hypothetical protein DPMN_116125 [Dreissena polymorpha]